MPKKYWVLGLIALYFLAVVNFKGGACNINETFIKFLNSVFQNYTNLTYKIDCKNDFAVVNFSLFLPSRSLEVSGKVLIYDNKIWYAYYDLNKNIFQRSVHFKEKIVIPKRERPEIILGVMSFCPFGNEAENRLLNLLDKYIKENKIDFKIVYIISKVCNNKTLDCFSSLHGKEELLQDIREYCVYKKYGFEKWKDFVLEVNKECSLSDLNTCWKEVAKKVGLNVSEIEECVKNKGYEIAEELYNLSRKYDISASPTLIINGVKIEGLRNDYEKLIKQAFK